MGGFLMPPGHPNHEHYVSEYVSPRGRRELGSYALDSVAESEWIPAAVRARARRILDNAELRCSELWVRDVYGYFRNSYLPESGSTNVSDMVTDATNQLPADRHAAVAFIRRFFPDHAARTDLITDARFCYGSHACVKCGQRVQYDARLDAYAPFGVPSATCESGGVHEWPAREGN
jgi:hypothetical protein